MVKSIGLLLFAIALFALAIWCLFFPQQVQGIARKVANYGISTKIKSVTSYMRLVAQFVESSQYQINVRIVGFLSLVYSLFVIWMLLKHFQGEY